MRLVEPEFLVQGGHFFLTTRQTVTALSQETELCLLQIAWKPALLADRLSQLAGKFFIRLLKTK
jgi:hypothetical protein